MVNKTSWKFYHSLVGFLELQQGWRDRGEGDAEGVKSRQSWKIFVFSQRKLKIFLRSVRKTPLFSKKIATPPPMLAASRHLRVAKLKNKIKKNPKIRFFPFVSNQSYRF
jgi:hypothetical protein